MRLSRPLLSILLLLPGCSDNDSTDASTTLRAEPSRTSLIVMPEHRPPKLDRATLADSENVAWADHVALARLVAEQGSDLPCQGSVMAFAAGSLSVERAAIVETPAGMQMIGLVQSGRVPWPGCSAQYGQQVATCVVHSDPYAIIWNRDPGPPPARRFREPNPPDVSDQFMRYAAARLLESDEPLPVHVARLDDDHWLGTWYLPAGSTGQAVLDSMVFTYTIYGMQPGQMIENRGLFRTRNPEGVPLDPPEELEIRFDADGDGNPEILLLDDRSGSTAELYEWEDGRLQLRLRGWGGADCAPGADQNR